MFLAGVKNLDWKSFDVLVVDDEEDNLDAFRFAFRKSFELHYALGGAQALDMLDRLDPAVIVSDQRMPGMSGIEFLKRAKERRPDTIGILLTAYAELPVLIDAVNSGAVERYVQKPWDSKELTVILRQAINAFGTVRENRRLREQLAHYAGYLEREQRDPIDFGELATESPAMKAAAERIEEVSPTDTPVLIQAEPGCEQEVAARAVHVGSPRESQPFVRVTCAAFRGDALERELFGWRRGAFEGAYADRAGRFELAHRGTIYLESPESPSPSLQARLLRLLTAGEVERLGSTDAIEVDARVIISTTEPLDVWWGDVLPELRSRLSVFSVRLPPLRERSCDVVPLAEHFLTKYARRNARAATSLTPEAQTKLMAYDYPGNGRELENVVERAAIHARGDSIQPGHLDFGPGHVIKAPSARAEALGALPDGDGKTGNLDTRLEDIERRALLAALTRCNGNKAEVARSLGIQRTTLYYRLKRLGIET